MFCIMNIFRNWSGGTTKGCNGMKYIATAVCYFTKFVEAKPIPEKTEYKLLVLYMISCVDMVVSK